MEQETLHTIIEVVVPILGAAIGWLYVRLRNAELKIVKMSTEQDQMKTDLAEGNESFKELRADIKELTKSINDLKLTIANSVWKGVGEQTNG